MGRPRTPTNVLDARGAFKKNPQRKRENEPEAVGSIGEPPAHFADDESAAWREIVGSCHEGVLCVADRIAVEQAAYLLAMSRRPRGVNEDGTESAGMKSSDRQMLIALLARFGMTPSDRSKVIVPKKQEANPFAALLGKGKKA